MCRNLSNVSFSILVQVFYIIFFFFPSQAGRTKHIKLCKQTGNFGRSDITVFVCNECGYLAKSSRGLTQHKQQGSTCKDTTLSRTMSTMSKLELSLTTVSV